MTAGKREIQYLVLPDTTNPYLLARVRWPDVFQAISAARPDWQDDLGLFDLPYDPSSTRVTLAEAAALAAEWGAHLPADGAAQTSTTSFIRRMPANWSNLSPAEKRAWSLTFVKTGKRATAAKERSSARGVATSRSRLGRRRRGVVAPADTTRTTDGAAVGRLHAVEACDLDLTDTSEDALAAEDA